MHKFSGKAKQVADALLPAFDTVTGVPKALINPTNNASFNYGWALGGKAILSEFGTLHLEFLYLSELTGDPVYRNKVIKITKIKSVFIFFRSKRFATFWIKQRKRMDFIRIIFRWKLENLKAIRFHLERWAIAFTSI